MLIRGWRHFTQQAGPRGQGPGGGLSCHSCLTLDGAAARECAHHILRSWVSVASTGLMRDTRMVWQGVGYDGVALGVAASECRLQTRPQAPVPVALCSERPGRLLEQ